MAFTKVATIAEIPAGKSKQIKVGPLTLALFNFDGAIHALDDACPHRGGPLHEGKFDGLAVVCPWHAARFDLTTGGHLCPPANRGVTCYVVKQVGDEIQVDLP